jgi:hypothetical protein
VAARGGQQHRQPTPELAHRPLQLEDRLGGLGGLHRPYRRLGQLHQPGGQLPGEHMPRPVPQLKRRVRGRGVANTCVPALTVALAQDLRRHDKMLPAATNTSRTDV